MRTIKEINEKIKKGEAVVLTADEVSGYRQAALESAAHKVGAIARV